MESKSSPTLLQIIDITFFKYLRAILLKTGWKDNSVHPQQALKDPRNDSTHAHGPSTKK